MERKDLLVVGLYLLSVLVIALLFVRRQKTDEDYFLGGRSLPWWALSASLAKGEIPLLTLLTLPGLVYAFQGNFTFLQLVFGYLVARPIVSFFLVPHFFDGERVTVYELLERRFGRSLRTVVASLFLVVRTVADGVRLLLTCVALAAVAHALNPKLLEVRTTVWLVLGLGALMLAVTLLGGMRALVWVDTLQLGVFLAGLGAALYSLLHKVPGGLPAVTALGQKYRKLLVTDSLDRGYVGFWAGIVGGCFLALYTLGADQHAVQRSLSAKSSGRAVAAILSSGVLVLAQAAVMLYLGLVLFAVYTPYKYPTWGVVGGTFLPFQRANAILPHAVAHQMPDGVVGLFVAALLAAALSPSLCSVAATAVNDVFRPRWEPRDAKGWLAVGRWATLAAGLLQIGVALLVRRKLPVSLEHLLAAAVVVNGPILGLFLLNTFTVRAGGIGATAGLVSGALAAVYLLARSALAWPWHIVVSALTTLIVGGLVGWVMPRPGWEEDAAA